MANKLPENVKDASGPSWKKVLWWCVGILGVLGALTLILCLIRRKGPISTTSEVINTIRRKVDQIDVRAKIEVAQAEGVEQNVIDQISDAAEIKDERERLQALAAALAEDY